MWGNYEFDTEEVGKKNESRTKELIKTKQSNIVCYANTVDLEHPKHTAIPQ